MTITIEHINEEAMNELINECTIRVIDSCQQMEEGLFSITLNENAILKTLGDELLIDLCGNKCFLSQNDFFSIIIE